MQTTSDAVVDAWTGNVSVLVIDDHPLFRDALTSALRASFEQVRTREAHSLESGLAELAVAGDGSVDIALLDLNLPGVQHFDALLELRGRYPKLPVLVVSGFEQDTVIAEALSFGAAGYIPKSAGKHALVDAVCSVLRGEVYTPAGYTVGDDSIIDDEKRNIIERIASLTPQQLRVLNMLREGLLNKQIAHELGVGATTVKAHVSEILRKLKVYNRTQAVILVSRLGDEFFEADTPATAGPLPDSAPS
ncbi:MAG: response regulator transcription factor [Pseudomonadota bacterium]